MIALLLKMMGFGPVYLCLRQRLKQRMATAEQEFARQQAAIRKEAQHKEEMALVDQVNLILK